MSEATPYEMDQYNRPLSPDRKWAWDGTTWIPASQPPATSPVAIQAAAPVAGQAEGRTPWTPSETEVSPDDLPAFLRTNPLAVSHLTTPAQAAQSTQYVQPVPPSVSRVAFEGDPGYGRIASLSPAKPGSVSLKRSLLLVVAGAFTCLGATVLAYAASVAVAINVMVSSSSSDGFSGTSGPGLGSTGVSVIGYALLFLFEALSLTALAALTGLRKPAAAGAAVAVLTTFIGVFCFKAFGDSIAALFLTVTIGSAFGVDVPGSAFAGAVLVAIVAVTPGLALSAWSALVGDDT